MTRWPVFLGIAMLLSGLSLCSYLVQRISPFLANGQDDVQVIALMFLGLFLSAAGAFSLISRKLQHSWPGLTGSAHADVSLRHGVLAGLALCIMAMLALYDLLDFAMAVSVVFLILLLETFVQNRKAA